jgi:membrane dipeptidase
MTPSARGDCAPGRLSRYCAPFAGHPPGCAPVTIDTTLKTLTGNGIVWDNHACMPLRPDDLGFLPQLERVRDAGIDVMTLNVAYGEQDSRLAFAMLETFRKWVQERPREYMLVSTPRDVEVARTSGRLGICFDIEGMDALDGDTANVGKFYELGVRWMLATYNRPNAAGGGCLAKDDGLTAYGRRVVAEMNRVGMIVCGTHCGYRTARDLIEASADPVIFSHSNPRGVWDHPRNLPDDLMKACAARGGVIGINGFGPFLGANDASTATYVKHVEYALDLVGEDHVGIALDYVFDREEFDETVAAHPEMFPPEFYSQGASMVEPWRLPEIAQVLAKRGHSTATLKKLLGGNHLRIASQVWH